ncbi:MAG: hypothetical protein WA220_13465 [Candidatus Nitrosopolaris sp.]
MVIRTTNNKALTLIGVFMVIALIIAASCITQPASALKSKGATCKDNHKNVACLHLSSGSMNTKQNDNGKQSNSDPQKNVPFELPFP